MNSLKILGKSYVPYEQQSLKWEIWMQARASEAGLTTIPVVKGETADQFVARALDITLRSGKALVMLGGFLLPEGTAPEDWDEKTAAEITADLERLTSPADKEAARGAIAAMLMGFFRRGIASFATSPSFSSPPTPDAAASDPTDGPAAP
jgi:hypothetical protein